MAARTKAPQVSGNTSAETSRTERLRQAKLSSRRSRIVMAPTTVVRQATWMDSNQGKASEDWEIHWAKSVSCSACANE